METGGRAFALNYSVRLKAGLTLINQFFGYAAQAFTGNGKLNISDLKWLIPPKKARREIISIRKRLSQKDKIFLLNSDLTINTYILQG